MDIFEEDNLSQLSFDNDIDLKNNKEVKKTSISITNDDTDYYNDDNIEYFHSNPYPVVPCPTNEFSSNGFQQNNKIFHNNPNKNHESQPILPAGKYVFINENQVINSISKSNNDDILLDKSCFVDTKAYEISQKDQFRFLYEIKDSNFSKEANRQKIYKLLGNIDFRSTQKVTEAKEKINPFEEIFEGLFHRNSSIQLANIDYLFKNNLLKKDNINDTSNVLIIGDDGGFTDYLSWRQRDFIIKIYTLCPNYSKFSTTNFINLVNNDLCSLEKLYISEKVKSSNEESILELDEYDNFSSDTIREFASNLREQSEGVMLYIAKKKYRFDNEYKENKYKKFFLINTIIGLSVISPEGIFLIKLYETYTNFTLSIIYLLYAVFDNITIFKPYSSHKSTSARYLVCDGYKPELSDEIIEKLYEIYDDYLLLLNKDKDLESLLKINIMSQNIVFKNYIFETNNDIDEKRINSLIELSSSMNGENKLVYDKMGLKKKCLDLWKIPVKKYKATEEYNYKRSLYLNSKNSNSNDAQVIYRPVNDIEKAREFKNYDTYNDKGKDFIDMITKSKKNDKFNSSNIYYNNINDEKDDEDEERRFSYSEKKELPAHLRPTKEIKKEEREKKKEESKTKPKAEEKGLNQKRMNEKDIANYKHNVVKEIMKNKKEIENNKQVLSEDMLAELMKYKK